MWTQPRMSKQQSEDKMCWVYYAGGLWLRQFISNDISSYRTFVPVWSRFLQVVETLGLLDFFCGPGKSHWDYDLCCMKGGSGQTFTQKRQSERKHFMYNIRSLMRGHLDLCVYSKYSSNKKAVVNKSVQNWLDHKLNQMTAVGLLLHLLLIVGSSAETWADIWDDSSQKGSYCDILTVISLFWLSKLGHIMPFALWISFFII